MNVQIYAIFFEKETSIFFTIYLYMLKKNLIFVAMFQILIT